MSEVKKPTAVTFIPMKQMTIEQLKQLPLGNIHLSQNIFRGSTVPNYTATLKLFNGTMNIQFRIDESLYQIVRAKRADVRYTNFDIKAPFRVVHGTAKNTDGEELSYYYIEVKLIPDYQESYLNSMLSKGQCDQINFTGHSHDTCIYERGFSDKLEQITSLFGENKQPIVS